ncbi:hypothetical protein Ctob_005056 [Chrysochromulina tobinii]|uniref:Uncharacterized protein n=1 Tax=Chrysochromulina tobinii TaxID=1460289 RepID=A0A0M0K3I7_9EUKA|nr:hypothetical protein Ctob_005056 [Chrysochromulina tobinii]|eukprot:KOO33369.1 hypothetical protein Ctob_005056 [Chrysochromulina sp. CCMP291]
MHGSPPQKQQQLTANDASPPDPLRSPEPQPLADGDRREITRRLTERLKKRQILPAPLPPNIAKPLKESELSRCGGENAKMRRFRERIMHRHHFEMQLSEQYMGPIPATHTSTMATPLSTSRTESASSTLGSQSDPSKVPGYMKPVRPPSETTVPTSGTEAPPVPAGSWPAGSWFAGSALEVPIEPTASTDLKSLAGREGMLTRLLAKHVSDQQRELELFEEYARSLRIPLEEELGNIRSQIILMTTRAAKSGRPKPSSDLRNRESELKKLLRTLEIERQEELDYFEHQTHGQRLKVEEELERLRAVIALKAARSATGRVSNSLDYEIEELAAGLKETIHSGDTPVIEPEVSGYLMGSPVPDWQAEEWTSPVRVADVLAVAGSPGTLVPIDPASPDPPAFDQVVPFDPAKIRDRDMVSEIDFIVAKPGSTENVCKVKEAGWVPSQAWFEQLRYYPTKNEELKYGESEVAFSGNTHGPDQFVVHIEQNLFVDACDADVAAVCKAAINTTRGVPCCDEQSKKIVMLSTITLFAEDGVLVLYGELQDRVGARNSLLVAGSIMSTGLGILAYNSLIADIELLWYSGFFLLGVAGPGIFLSALSLGEKFQGLEPVITPIITAMFDASSLVTWDLEISNHISNYFNVLFPVLALLSTPIAVWLFARYAAATLFGPARTLVWAAYFHFFQNAARYPPSKLGRLIGYSNLLLAVVGDLPPIPLYSYVKNQRDDAASTLVFTVIHAVLTGVVLAILVVLVVYLRRQHRRMLERFTIMTTGA